MGLGAIEFGFLFLGIFVSLTAFSRAERVVRSLPTWRYFIRFLAFHSWSWANWVWHMIWTIVYLHPGIITFLVLIERFKADNLGIYTLVDAYKGQNGLWTGILAILIVLLYFMIELPSPLFVFHSWWAQVAMSFVAFGLSVAVFVMLLIYGNANGTILAAIILSGILSVALFVFFIFTIKWWRNEQLKKDSVVFFKQQTQMTKDSFHSLKTKVTVTPTRGPGPGPAAVPPPMGFAPPNVPVGAYGPANYGYPPPIPGAYTAAQRAAMTTPQGMVRGAATPLPPTPYYGGLNYSATPFNNRKTK